MRRLEPTDYVRSRWRNGRGETALIAAAPRTGPEGSPEWRLSLATVEAEGPFSAFPEYTRILTVVAGAGLRLTGPGGFDETVRQGGTLRFPGALEAHCRLIGGPVRNLNLMFGPAVAAEATPFRLSDRPFRLDRPCDRLQFLFCASGAARIDGAATGEIGAGETLRLDASDPAGEIALARRCSDPALVVLASIGDDAADYV